MRKRIISGMVSTLLLCGVLNGCILPKEEELITTPVVEAYEREDFKTTTVKKGDLVNAADIDCSVLGINEKVLSFELDDMSYRGVYVKAGDSVEANTIVAELVSDGVTNMTLLQLRAPFNGLVTYALEVKEGERSLMNKRVVIINNGSAYYLIAQTPYWERFQAGDVYNVKFNNNGVYPATVVEPEEIGLERLMHTGEENEVYPVYFRIDDMSACLYSDLRGSFSINLEEKKDVLYVPTSAVTTIDDKEIVYYEDEDGIRNVKYIETGLEAKGKTEVISGLNEGDVIILE